MQKVKYYTDKIFNLVLKLKCGIAEVKNKIQLKRGTRNRKFYFNQYAWHQKF